MCYELCAMQATIMTDPGTADRTYIGPMNPELVEEIIAKVSQRDSLGSCLALSAHLRLSCVYAQLSY